MTEFSPCDRCGVTTAFFEKAGEPTPTTCNVCLALGDRSLVSLLGDPTPERRAAFRRAPSWRPRKTSVMRLPLDS